jgi:hypothetical protein
MRANHITEIQSNDLVRQRLAKFLALHCFRNTKLEDFHDRLSDKEMKTLMIDVVNHCDYVLSILFKTENGGKLIELFKEHDPVPQWDDPKPLNFSDDFLRALESLLPPDQLPH